MIEVLFSAGIAEQEFFAARDDAIAGAPNAAQRKRLIAALPLTNPELWEEWSRESRVAQGATHFVRQSNRYPLCGVGDVNTFALFAEHNWRLLGPRGRAGFIVPTGIATDDTTKAYFGALVAGRHLARLYSFENEALLFRDVHHAFKFALLTLDGAGESEAADLFFFARYPADLNDPERHFALTAEDFTLLNPNTRTCPTFRSSRDARLNLALYRRAGVLWQENATDGNPWGIRFLRMLDMTNDSGLFRTGAELAQAGWTPQGNCFVRGEQVILPLYEAKMIHHYDHRFGSYEAQTDAQANQGKLPEFSDADHADPNRTPLPRYWVAKEDVEEKLGEWWEREWLVGWRDITLSTNMRTVIAALVPRVGVGNTMPLLMASVSPDLLACLYANLCSIVLDYTARQKVGGNHLSYGFLRQLPTVSRERYEEPSAWEASSSVKAWMFPRVLELTYTAWDLQPFAQDCGDDGPPYLWDPARRFQLQCELDAAFFHLYGVSRDDADYILSTFPIVESRDIARHGEPHTRRVVLECYDALAQAAATGRPYVSPLRPPRRVANGE